MTARALWMTMAIVWLGTTPATAYECLTIGDSISVVPLCTQTDCMWITGSSASYSIVAGDFTTSEEDEIELAVHDAFAAGSGEVLRGAEWAFVRGSDVSSMSLTDNTNTLSKLTPTEMTALGIPTSVNGIALISVTAHPGCNRRAFDVVIRSAPPSGQAWTIDPPKLVNNDTHQSLPMVVIHEFGHVFGFAHVSSPEDKSHTMLGGHPHGGDHGGKWRIDEDTFKGILDQKPDSSSGANLSIAKFRPLSSFSEEIWDGEDWFLADTWCIGDSYPQGMVGSEQDWGPTIHLTGTQTISGVDVTYFLKPVSDACGGSTSHEVARNTWTMSVNGPVRTEPIYTVPNGISPGTYRLCAMVDADEDVTETVENDNRVTGDDDIVVRAATHPDCQ